MSAHAYDSRPTVSFIGDSRVHGTGDHLNLGRGGYVERLQNSLPHLRIYSFATRGGSSRMLLERMRQALATESAWPERGPILESDIIFIDVGRTDYYFVQDPGRSAANIRRILRTLRSAFERDRQPMPLFYVLIQSHTFQPHLRAYLKRLGVLLGADNNSAYRVIDLDSALAFGHYARDGVHPNSSGYDVIARRLAKILQSPESR